MIDAAIYGRLLIKGKHRQSGRRKLVQRFGCKVDFHSSLPVEFSISTSFPLMIPDVLRRFAVDSAPAQSFALVPDGLAFGERDLALDEILFEVEPGGNQSEAAF